eukprot:gb/GECG01013195.1/.p1 GENE.gb/GECG01013195.1/~~gb/GECG01013195.1/.p1  ORF type:complete len:137 (+),score=8.35 gb/GECG01013195.1/:1-411(+)
MCYKKIEIYSSRNWSAIAHHQFPEDFHLLIVPKERRCFPDNPPQELGYLASSPRTSFASIKNVVILQGTDRQKSANKPRHKLSATIVVAGSHNTSSWIFLRVGTSLSTMLFYLCSFPAVPCTDGVHNALRIYTHIT